MENGSGEVKDHSNDLVPVVVDDNMYSQVDLDKKYKLRSDSDRPLSTPSSDPSSSACVSPAPPIPTQGDLGDLSEFEPPPIPVPQVDLADEVNKEPNETPTVEKGTKSEDGVLSEDQGALKDSDPPPDDSSAPPAMATEEQRMTRAQSSTSSSSSSSDAAPVYDSLLPQDPPTELTYDSLAPLSDPEPSDQNDYDSLLPETIKSNTYDEVEDSVRHRVDSLTKQNGIKHHPS